MEDLLLAATPHTETIARCAGSQVDQEWIGVLGGVRVRLPNHAVHPDPAGTARTSLLVTLPAARAALSPGFLLVDGTVGPPAGGPILRVYVCLATVAHAEQVWRAGLRVLEGQRVRYRAKVCSTPSLLPRRDGMVVYLGPDSWSAVPALAGAVSAVSASDRGVSVFARQVAPGVSTAWEPDDRRPGMHRLSFGEHRALAIADGLLDWAEQGGHPEHRASIVSASLKRANIDCAAPFRNADSPPEPAIHEMSGRSAEKTPAIGAPASRVLETVPTHRERT